MSGTITYKGRVYYGSAAHSPRDTRFIVTADSYIQEVAEGEGEANRFVYLHGEMHLWETPANQHELPDLILTVTEGRVKRVERADTWAARLAAWPQRPVLSRLTAQAERA